MIHRTHHILSTKDNITIIEDIISEIEALIFLSNDVKTKIKVSLKEAVVNSIIHGNDEELNKKVIIHYELTKLQVEFCVSDEGSGFSLSEIPDPTLPENIEKEGGRGVHIIKMLSKEVSFCQNQNGIKFSISLN